MGTHGKKAIHGKKRVRKILKRLGLVHAAATEHCPYPSGYSKIILHIPSSCSKINQLPGITRSGCNGIFREKEERREKKKIVCVNNGQIRLQPPPWVAHTSRLDQNYVLILKGPGLVQLQPNTVCKKPA